ncbi:MAG: hypothetical protein WBC83_01480 [Minisyncoccia bacterium]
MTKLIISFIVLVLSAAFAFLYVLPAYNVSKERRADIETLSKNLSTSDEIIQLIADTKNNLNSIESSKLARFEVFLHEEVDPIRFANNIQNIGADNMVSMTSIKVDIPGQDAKQGGALQTGGVAQSVADQLSLEAKLNQAEGTTQAGKKYATTKATITFETSFERFQLFLNDLETSLGLMDVTGLSFVVSSETDETKMATQSSPNYQFIMTVETFSLK